ncbi:54S ribosomal protein L4 mitochondrial, partial [Coemansia sp. RSA 2049]
MFGRVTAITRQLSTRRATQNSLITRGLEEFFEGGERLPKKPEQTGRAWAASELRLKSWEDLHKLWYVVLKERNILASQTEEANRLGVHQEAFRNKGRIVKCKKTMARIKTVLNERKIAWEKAQKIAADPSKKVLEKPSETSGTGTGAGTGTSAAEAKGPLTSSDPASVAPETTSTATTT